MGKDIAEGIHVVIGAGPVGSAIAEQLADRDAKVRVVTRSGGGPDRAGVELLRADISVPADAVRACEGASVVYAAAQPEYHRWPQEFPALQAAMLGAAEAAGAVYVGVENTYMYAPTTVMAEATPETATTRKGRVRAQLAAELREADASGRVRTTSGRASDFFGPRVAGSAVGDRFFPPILAGKDVRVPGDPDARHSYTFIPDFAAALIVLGSDERAWGRAWHVPNAPAVSTRRFAELAYAAAGTTGRVRPVPKLALRGLGLFVPPVKEMVEMLYEFEHDFVVDSTACTATFGVEATPIEDSLATTVAWYRDHV